MKKIKKIFKYSINFLTRLLLLPSKIFPHFLLMRTDVERFGIDQFMDFAKKLVRPTDRLLDAGSGSGRYSDFFSFAHYESTDFSDIFHKDSLKKQDFICTLDAIPQENDTYDVIINTQVLEHVQYPQKVVHELYRVLKPGGKLFLTTNQMWGVHGAPYNFFFYTHYGLKQLFDEAGFTTVFIRPRGGLFWLLGKLSKELPHYIFNQHAFSGYKKSIYFHPAFRLTFLGVILYPFFIISVYVCGIIMPLICFYLDVLDKQKDFTLGYQCYCLKE